LSKIRDRARSESSSSSNMFDSEPESSEPDWLRGLQDDSTSGSSQGEGDDWLSQLGDDSSTGETAPGAGRSEVSAEGLDSLSSWLGGLGQEETPAAEPEQSQPSFGDWGSFGREEEPPSPTTPTQPAASGDADDWMKGIGAWQVDQPLEDQAATPPAEIPTQETSSPFGQDLGWGMNFEDIETPAAPAADENLDWFKGLDAMQPSETPSEGREAADLSDFSLNSFFTSEEPAVPGAAVQSDYEVPASPEEEAPDWLKAFESPTSEAPVQPTSSDAFPWDGFGQVDESATLSQSEEPAGTLGQQENIPDWLAGMSAASAIEESLDQDPNQGRQPAWLSGESETQDAPSLGGLEEGGLPDWLSSDAPPAQDFTFAQDTEFRTEAALPSEPGFPGETEFPLRAETPGEAAEIPDWFSTFGSEETPAAETAAAPDETGGADWFNQLGAAPPKPKRSEQAPGTRSRLFRLLGRLDREAQDPCHSWMKVFLIGWENFKSKNQISLQRRNFLQWKIPWPWITSPLRWIYRTG
jgi:hypothetical protein